MMNSISGSLSSTLPLSAKKNRFGKIIYIYDCLNSPTLSDEFNSFPLSNMVLTSKLLYAVVPTFNN